MPVALARDFQSSADAHTTPPTACQKILRSFFGQRSAPQRDAQRTGAKWLPDSTIAQPLSIDTVAPNQSHECRIDTGSTEPGRTLLVWGAAATEG